MKIMLIRNTLPILGRYLPNAHLPVLVGHEGGDSQATVEFLPHKRRSKTRSDYNVQVKRNLIYIFFVRGEMNNTVECVFPKDLVL